MDLRIPVLQLVMTISGEDRWAPTRREKTNTIGSMSAAELARHIALRMSALRSELEGLEQDFEILTLRMADTSSEAPVIPARLLTVEQTAAALSIGRTGVFGLVSAGDLRSIMVGGSRRIPVEAIDEFIQRRATEDAA